MLTIVPTPIGNLKDITLRVLEVLREVDGIICEDSRRTSLLLNHYQINKPLTSLNDYNEAKVVPSIVDRLKNGENLALVSDAGTPLISDPGYKLVRECINQGISVDSLPGPSSVITALTLSGLPPDKFMFLGYLPEKSGHRMELLKKLLLISKPETVIPANAGIQLNKSRSKLDLRLRGDDKSGLKITFVIFVAPHKLVKTLEEMKEVMGDIEVILAHELTKIHQSVENKKISQWLDTLKNPKGEFVLLFRIEPAV